MILQALYDYYERKRDSLPDLGIERKELPFLLVLNSDGTFLHIQDTRQGEGKRRRGNHFLVPQAVKKSVNIVAKERFTKKLLMLAQANYAWCRSFS